MTFLATSSVATAALVSLMVANASHGAEFIPVCDVGSLAGALEVSDDGRTVVCHSLLIENRSEASIWTEADGMVRLGFLRNGDERSGASGLSGDGNVIVGRSGSWPDDVEAFRWTAESGMTGLGKMPNGYGTTAHAASRNGDVIVGRTPPSSYRAWHWTEAEGIVNLSEGFEIGFANDVSSDGSVIVGEAGGAAAGEAVRWKRGEEMLRLEPPDGFEARASRASSVSSDGSAIVGSIWPSNVADGSQPFLWTGEQMTLLGDFATNSPQSGGANGVSDFGKIVVGSSRTDDVTEAFIWHDNLGMLNLKSVLESEYGLGAALEGWELTRARDISPNGRFIVGSGINPQGDTQGWLARLDYAVPEPASGASVVMFVVVLTCTRRRMMN